MAMTTLENSIITSKIVVELQYTSLWVILSRPDASLHRKKPTKISPQKTSSDGPHSFFGQ